jgi:hypothetical protein
VRGDTRKAQTNLLNSLITVFQYMEQLTDYQILDAVCNRVDLKYALHLPLIYSSFNPNALCEFRMQLSQDPGQRQAFQMLLDQLVAFGFLYEAEECRVSAMQVVNALCTGNRFEAVVEAMFLALEVIAATDSDWLRKTAKPYWYVRYSRRSRLACWPGLAEKWQSVTGVIAADIQYLLSQIEQSDLPAVASMPEVQALKRVWVEQFTLGEGDDFQQHRVVWRQTCCASCQREILAREEQVSTKIHREHPPLKSNHNDNEFPNIVKGE